jgi:hypothetical protein
MAVNFKRLVTKHAPFSQTTPVKKNNVPQYNEFDLILMECR